MIFDRVMCNGDAGTGQMPRLGVKADPSDNGYDAGPELSFTLRARGQFGRGA